MLTSTAIILISPTTAARPNKANLKKPDPASIAMNPRVKYDVRATPARIEKAEIQKINSDNRKDKISTNTLYSTRSSLAI
jgi:hypothetical protein